MDDHRFDALSRLLACTLSRRRATPVVASVVAGLAAIVAGDDTEAKKKPRCLKTGTRCTAHSGRKGDHCRKCCSGLSEPRASGKGRRCTCKAEDVACTSQRECCSGKCTGGECGACPPAEELCPDGCVDLQSDEDNCGACDVTCTSYQTCTAGTCQSLPCAEGGPCGIFVTDTVHNGDFGGAAQVFATADGLCASDAAAAGLSGTYKAWISSDAVNARDRMVHSPTPYLRRDGVVIANNWDDLTDGSLQAPINRTAANVEIASAEVWTGSDGSGFATAYTCGSWSNGGSDYGWVGSTSATDSNWSWIYYQFCSIERPLYCIEQQTT